MTLPIDGHRALQALLNLKGGTEALETALQDMVADAFDEGARAARAPLGHLLDPMPPNPHRRAREDA